MLVASHLINNILNLIKDQEYVTESFPVPLKTCNFIGLSTAIKNNYTCWLIKECLLAPVKKNYNGLAKAITQYSML